jgi:hypothetical protein
MLPAVMMGFTIEAKGEAGDNGSSKAPCLSVSAISMNVITR